MAKFITTDWSDRVGIALAKSGVIDDNPDYIRRIVIDLVVGEPAKVYVEHYADDEKLAEVMRDFRVEQATAAPGELR